MSSCTRSRMLQVNACRRLLRTMQRRQKAQKRQRMPSCTRSVEACRMVKANACRRLLGTKQRRQKQQQDKKKWQREEGWGSLGEDLHWRIMTFLPFRKVSQFRAVCKAWNSVLSSAEFWRYRQNTNTRLGGGWLVSSRYTSEAQVELMAFDTSCSTWRSLTSLIWIKSSVAQAGLAADLGGPHCSLVARLGSLSRLMVTSSASGLMCFLCSPFPEEEEFFGCPLDDEAYYLVVLNPITGAYTRLPPNPKHSTDLKRWYPFPFHISLQSLSCNHYRVFLWGGGKGSLEFYDSTSRSWTVGRSVSPYCGNDRLGAAVDLEQADLILCLRMCTRPSEDYGPCFLGTYSVKRDEWCQVRVPYLPEDHAFSDGQVILMHQGRILLAAIVFIDFTRLPCLVVWELQRQSKSSTLASDWVEVGRTPALQDLEVIGAYDPHYTEVALISTGSLICVRGVCYNCNHPLVTYYRPLVYNVDNGSWYHLPPYKGKYDFMAVCGLQPSLVL